MQLKNYLSEILWLIHHHPEHKLRNQWLKEQNLNCPQSTLTLLSQVEKQHDRVEKHKKYS